MHYRKLLHLYQKMLKEAEKEELIHFVVIIFIIDGFSIGGEHPRIVSLVIGFEHSCPWSREGLSSDGRTLASNFFVSLGLALSLVSSNSSLGFIVV